MNRPGRHSGVRTGRRPSRRADAARYACTAALLAGFALAATVRPAWAQNINETVRFEELGFTTPALGAARPMGLAGAYAAVGNDVHSLIYNPAGLARLKRIELALGVHQERNEVDNVFFDSREEIHVRTGGVDVLSAAYPFPTYRGSLVGAFGIYRLNSGLLDLALAGTNEEFDREDQFLLQQSGSVYSYNLGLGVDLSPTASGGVTLFMLDGNVDALTQYSFTEFQSTPVRSEFVKEDVSYELDGWGARIGAQFFVHRAFRVGAVFTTPTWVNLTGSAETETAVNVDNGLDSFERTEEDREDDYIVPFRADVGVAFTPRNWLLTAEIGYVDWSEASINRKRFRNTRLEPMFREVLDYRFGVEVVLPWLPARVRGGYAYRPYPLKYLQGDRIDNNDLQEAVVDDEQREIAVGVGGLVGAVMTVDAAFVYTTGARSIDTLSDRRTSSRYLLTASYRF